MHIPWTNNSAVHGRPWGGIRVGWRRSTGEKEDICNTLNNKALKIFFLTNWWRTYFTRENHTTEGKIILKYHLLVRKKLREIRV